MDTDLPFFSRSPLLGDRAETVYKWFLTALHLEGDVAECGVCAGHTSYEFVHYLERMGIPKRVHMFDTFTGLPPIITEEERQHAAGGHLEPGRLSCSLGEVLVRMEPLGQYQIHPGLFSETFASFSGRLCFIHADADLYESTVEIIDLADRCLVPGGRIVFDDYDNPRYPGVSLAIRDRLDPARYTIIDSGDTLQCFAIRKPCSSS